MSTDKRQVATDALETVGTIIGESAGRDAIHLAVEPVIAAEMLRAGEDVGFVEIKGITDRGENTRFRLVGKCDNPVGIVDPFIRRPIKPKERFWLVVYPRQITSLRHVWTHPAFDGQEAPVASVGQEPDSEQWIRAYAASLPVKYDDLMEQAGYFVESGQTWHGGEFFDGWYLLDEFWVHYERVTGETVPEDKRGSFFSCSC